MLPYSGYAYTEAFLDMKQEAWITCHVNAYRYFGGVTCILIPDNLKTGVVKNSRTETVLNKAYQEMAEHYGTAILPARPHSPKDKAFVEGSVGVVSTWILTALRNRQFLSLMELNQAIWEKLRAFNHKPFQKREGSRASCFAEEKLFLLPLLATPFELAVWKVTTVQYNYHISAEHMNYSVPYEYIKQQVDVRLTRTTVEIFFFRTRIASHLRLHGRPNQYSTVGGAYAAGPPGLSAMEWRAFSPLGGAGRAIYRSCGTTLSHRPQGGKAVLQVVYDPAETGRVLFPSASGERLPESPLLHHFPQPEKRPVHPEIRTG